MAIAWACVAVNLYIQLRLARMHAQAADGMIACFGEGWVPMKPSGSAGSPTGLGDVGFEDRFSISQGSWTAVPGEPVTLTWSLVPDGTTHPGMDNQPSRMFEVMDEAFGSRELWIGLLSECFARWDVLSGVSYSRITDGVHEWDDGAEFARSPGSATRGDVRIGMYAIDGQSGTYASASGPGRGDIQIDIGDAPTFTGTNASQNYRIFRHTLMHEIGHTLGLSHSCPQNRTKLMEPTVHAQTDGPQLDDLRGGQYLVGDAYEPNDSESLATPIELLKDGGITLGNVPEPAIANASLLSLGRGTDVDWFRLRSNEPVLASVLATPSGGSYVFSAQGASGCPSNGAVVLPGRIMALSASLTSEAGELIGSDAATLGVSASIPNALLSAENALLRVSPVVPADDCQMYKLTITTKRPIVIATPGVYSVSLTWTAIPRAQAYDIYRTTGGSGEEFVGRHTLASWTDVGVVAGVRYQYRVGVSQDGRAEVRFGGTNATPLADGCPCDFNSDSSVDDSDFQLFAAAYDAVIVPPASPRCDLTADLVVDDLDFQVFAMAYDALVCP